MLFHSLLMLQTMGIVGVLIWPQSLNRHRIISVKQSVVLETLIMQELYSL